MRICKVCGVELTAENTYASRKQARCRRCVCDAVSRSAAKNKDSRRAARMAKIAAGGVPCVACDAELTTLNTYDHTSGYRCAACVRWAVLAGQRIPGRRDRRLVYLRSYYSANRARMLSVIRKTSAAWYEANKERKSATAAEWRARNPEQVLAKSRARRARIVGSGGHICAKEWREILAYFGGACAYCLRTDVKLTMDHVLAVSRGGEHVPSNVVPACKRCNSRKHARGILCMVAA